MTKCQDRPPLSRHSHLNDIAIAETNNTRIVPFKIPFWENVSLSRTMDNTEASVYLSQFIGKNLRIHTTDDRVFGGQMKCTDKVSLFIP